MRILTAVLVAITLAACGGTTSMPVVTAPVTPEVHVLSAELTLDGRDGVLTFAAHNAGAEPDTLTASTCSCATSAGSITGDATIASQETALFTLDGPYVVFTDLDRVPRRGTFVDVVLTFEHAGDVTTTAEVVRG